MSPCCEWGEIFRHSAPCNDTSVPKPGDVGRKGAQARNHHDNESSSGAGGPDRNGRITQEVRSSIESLAPGNNIDVKAMSGIVALAGTVPSQSVVEDARQAAQQIAGVKQVDTSALTVSNQ